MFLLGGLCALFSVFLLGGCLSRGLCERGVSVKGGLCERGSPSPFTGGHWNRWYASHCNAFFLPPANIVCKGYVFTHVCHSFCSQGREYLTRYLPRPPRTRCNPPDQVHPPGTRCRYTSLGPGTPPWDQVHPPAPGTPPRTRYTPPGTPHWSRACWEIRSTCGRSASYWNAILFCCNIYQRNKFWVWVKDMLVFLSFWCFALTYFIVLVFIWWSCP